MERSGELRDSISRVCRVGVKRSLRGRRVRVCLGGFLLGLGPIREHEFGVCFVSGLACHRVTSVRGQGVGSVCRSMRTKGGGFLGCLSGRPGGGAPADLDL